MRRTRKKSFCFLHEDITSGDAREEKGTKIT